MLHVPYMHHRAIFMHFTGTLGEFLLANGPTSANETSYVHFTGTLCLPHVHLTGILQAPYGQFTGTLCAPYRHLTGSFMHFTGTLGEFLSANGSHHN